MKLITNTAKAISSTLIETQSFAVHPHIQTVRSVLAIGNYEAPEASVNLPTDEGLLMAVEDVVKNTKTPTLKYIFLIGIGGSNLGTKAIYEAMFLTRDVVGKTYPKIIFVDTNNSALLESYLTLLKSLEDPDEYLLISISKSGGTTETIANTEIFLATVAQKWSSRPERLIIISDSRSPYLEMAQTIGAHCLTIPPQVGGRYSVFSAVGLVPLALAGLDIQELRRGAETMATTCSHPEVSQNPAATSALIQVQAYRAGKNIHDLFIFNSELESLGKWWRQLLGESVGKSVPNTSPVETVGIMPTVSIGSTDLHSVGQLYLGGPNDKITTFLSVKSKATDIPIPFKRTFPKLLPMINNRTTGSIMDAILEGTKVAYNENNRLFMEIQLDGLSLYELGAFMQFKMIETMYTARILGVNPFDQPNVESYKVKTKQILETKNNYPT